MASHEFIPPDVLETVVRKIANEFVTGGVSFEVLQAGYHLTIYFCTNNSLNSIREICTRAPLVMNADLLQDLTSYRSSRDKGVVNAARSLITLYREVAPEMLLRRDRGKDVSMAMSNGEAAPTLKFGVERGVKTGIEGLELLEAYKKEHNELDGDEEDEDGMTGCIFQSNRRLEELGSGK
jgi:protein SDA1